ncbi:hypothetical protein AURDEDRAFT_169684 [Auricularia subglabra TFB-10046 SS5]|nr:hypothetical protein AURDEDRAFT_169684 [Auricularia subglabra TFB-10046 SS5]
MSWYHRVKSPSPDFVRDPLSGWTNVSDAKLLATSDLHPSQLAAPRLEWGPYKAAAKKRSWDIPKHPHPLSLLLAQLARPKFCSSTRWTKAGLNAVKLFSSVDGAPLGSIGLIDLDAVLKLSSRSPFGMGSQTVYDEAVRRGNEVRAAQLQVALLQQLDFGDAACYFSDIAFQVGRYLFPGAHAVKLVLYKLAMYSEGGHFKMHKDTTHADSHVGTVLIGCRVAKEDRDPNDEEQWEALKHDFAESEDPDADYTAYSGGDLVILDDDGQEQRYHIKPGQVLAFCTDVAHAVDVVTSGVKITLQFDVYIEDESVQRDHTVSCVDPRDWREFYGRSRKGSRGDSSTDSETSAPVACPSCHYPGCVVVDKKRRDREPEIWPRSAAAFNEIVGERCPWGSSRHSLAHWSKMNIDDGRYPMETFDDAIDRFVLHILALLRETPAAQASDPAGARSLASSSQTTAPRPESADKKTASSPRTVAFLLSHMYRKRSIQPEYLKSVDAAIYHALVATNQLRVLLHHVTFEVADDGYNIERQRLAICPPYTDGLSPHDVAEPVLVLSRPGSDAIYLSTAQDEMIERGEIYVGNEALDEPSWYVAGAMFVSLL